MWIFYTKYVSKCNTYPSYRLNLLKFCFWELLLLRRPTQISLVTSSVSSWCFSLGINCEESQSCGSTPHIFTPLFPPAFHLVISRQFSLKKIKEEITKFGRFRSAHELFPVGGDSRFAWSCFPPGLPASILVLRHAGIFMCFLGLSLVSESVWSQWALSFVA